MVCWELGVFGEIEVRLHRHRDRFQEFADSSSQSRTVLIKMVTCV